MSHIIGSVHSPRSARNAGHRFTKNSYQLFFPRSPYLFGARNTISTNYTCCAVCTFHLLACQYTASGGMHQNVSYRSKFPYGLRTKHTRTPHSPSAFVSHIIGSVHSPRSARNAGHRFTKNSYQLFFSRFHTKIPIGLTPSGFFSYSLVTCIKRGTRHGAK